jgi:hypothetical protein
MKVSWMDIKRIICVCLAAFACQAGPLQAAELAGRIWFEHNKKPANKMHIVVICADNLRLESTSDRYGFYRRPGIPAKQSCYIMLDDGHSYSDPLLYYSGQGRDTQNFSVLRQGNKLRVRKY